MPLDRASRPTRPSARRSNCIPNPNLRSTTPETQPQTRSRTLSPPWSSLTPAERASRRGRRSRQSRPAQSYEEESAMASAMSILSTTMESMAAAQEHSTSASNRPRVHRGRTQTRPDGRGKKQRRKYHFTSMEIDSNPSPNPGQPRHSRSERSDPHRVTTREIPNRNTAPAARQVAPPGYNTAAEGSGAAVDAPTRPATWATPPQFSPHSRYPPMGVRAPGVMHPLFAPLPLPPPVQVVDSAEGFSSMTMTSNELTPIPPMTIVGGHNPFPRVSRITANSSPRTNPAPILRRNSAPSPPPRPPRDQVLTPRLFSSLLHSQATAERQRRLPSQLRLPPQLRAHREPPTWWRHGEHRVQRMAPGRYRMESPQDQWAVREGFRRYLRDLGLDERVINPDGSLPFGGRDIRWREWVNDKEMEMEIEMEEMETEELGMGDTETEEVEVEE